ncbi:MAG: hypothetical protein JWO67_1332 [Streptosporangiaceae bacterium]|nr:hypothetical protein [Streptosporangiaceae bacterium]
MAGIAPGDAERFAEEDEDPARIFAAFDAGSRALTVEPPGEADAVPGHGE